MRWLRKSRGTHAWLPPRVIDSVRYPEEIQMLYGSCLCGAVAFETQSLSGPIFHCNCQTCRKAHSAAFATTARTQRAYFKWSRGKEFLGHFESTPGKLRHFCTKCGSHLMAEWTNEPEVILRLGCLDTDPQARPSTHIWTSHRVPWLTFPADLPCLEKGPISPKVDDSET